MKEGRALNIVLRITEDGWEYEPDQRHAELIIEDMHLKDANAVTTPGGRRRPGRRRKTRKRLTKRTETNTERSRLEQII